MTGNATPLEIGLFLGSVFGDLAAVLLVVDAVLDLRALDGGAAQHRNLRGLAWARIWTDSYALYVFMVFSWIGWRAMMMPPTDVDRNGVPDLVSLLVILAFLGIVVFLLMLVLYLAWTRHNVLAFLVRSEPWDEHTERRQGSEPAPDAATNEGG